MPTPFSIAALKHVLPEFSLTAVTPEAFVFQQYLDFYQLRFGSEVTHRVGYVAAGGYKIATHYFEPLQPKGVLWLLHGYFDHTALYRHAIEFGVKQGLGVIVFDLPGHGLSSGEAAAIADFNEYSLMLKDLLEHFKPLSGQPWYVMAQSTGGAIVTDYALSQGIFPWEKIVLLAPLVRPCGWASINVSYTLLNAFTQTVSRQFVQNSNDLAFVEFITRLDPLQCKKVSVQWVGSMIRWVKRILQAGSTEMSALIIQGEQDKTVDYRFNLEVLKTKYRQPEIILLDKARHHLVNESLEIRSSVFQAAAEFLARV